MSRSFGFSLVLSLLALMLGGGMAFSAPAALEPANASWAVVLDKVVEDKPVTIYLATAGGKVTQAAGTGYNAALHTVDASGLKLEAGALKGTLKVTIEPDSYLPKDKKPISCEFQLDVAATADEVKGTYKGKTGDKETSGTATGKITAPVGILTQGAVDVILWNALVDGAPFLRDAQVTFSVDGGKAKDAKINWRKKDRFHWLGKIDSIELKFEAGVMTATIKATITSTSGVVGGQYTFAIDAKIIGDLVCGTNKVMIDDKERKVSYLMGSIKGASYQAAK
ncbi:MAG: hypothetical protein WCJ97_09350 [Phycisphaerae bacterium]